MNGNFTSDSLRHLTAHCETVCTTTLINGANYLSGSQQSVTKYLVQTIILLLLSLTVVFKVHKQTQGCGLLFMLFQKTLHHKSTVLELRYKNYDLLTKFGNTFKLFQAIDFQQSNCHLATPFSPRIRIGVF